ncbi:MAG: sporulation protein YjcZ [Bacilli bacterium]|nr:sporulation protein YjcZ [Bacilli bacterium]
MSNNSCGQTSNNCHSGSNGFLIIVVLYILLAIILGSCFF